MTLTHLHREEAPGVGDPVDATITDLAGQAPPCEECHVRERLPGELRCRECIEDGGRR